MSKFKVGDKVTLYRGSEFYDTSNDTELNGNIGEIECFTERRYNIDVTWGRVGFNSYTEADLVLVASADVSSEQPHVNTNEVTTKSPIKSTGGSSTYYDINVPEWLVKLLVERNESGNCFIKTEEINNLLGNDFNYGTLFKSLVRAHSIEQGVGKAGNNMSYECNKIRYYTDRIEEKWGRKQNEQ